MCVMPQLVARLVLLLRDTVNILGLLHMKPVAKRHYMVSGTLAPLYTVFGLKLGCSGAAAPIGDEVL